MNKGAHGGHGSGFLPTAKTGRGDEHADEFPIVRTLLPLLPSLVEKGLPLSREVTVASRDAKEETVVLLKFGRGDCGNGGFFGRGMHPCQDFLG